MAAVSGMVRRRGKGGKKEGEGERGREREGEGEVGRNVTGTVLTSSGDDSCVYGRRGREKGEREEGGEGFSPLKAYIVFTTGCPALLFMQLIIWTTGSASLC